MPLIFIFGLLAGFLALLTPCIFPMIPLTVSYFIDQNKLKYSSLISASLYGAFIILIYILLSLPFHLFDSLNPNILNTITEDHTQGLMTEKATFWGKKTESNLT